MEQYTIFDDPNREFTEEEIADGVNAHRADDRYSVPGFYETYEDVVLASKRFVDAVRKRASELTVAGP